MKFKRIASLAMTAVIAASLLAGCGNTGADSAGGNAQGDAQPQTATTNSDAGSGDAAAAPEVSHDS